MADMSDSYPDTSAVDRDFKELGDDGMDMSYLDDMLNTRRRSAEEDEKSEQKAEARLDELERREREAEDLRERSGEASEDAGEHGGNGGHAPAAGSTSQVATAPSTQEVHPDRDEDADEQSDEAEENEQQQEETPEPAAASPEPAPAPKAPEPEQQAEFEPEPEVTVVERHPLVGHTLDAGALTERNGGVQLRLPETIVDAVRTVLASTGYEKVAQIARGKLVTAYIAATLGVDLEVDDKETLALLEAMRGINPLLGGIETNVQLMLDQSEQIDKRMRQLDEKLAKLQLIDESTEMGVAYLLMNSTAKHPEITRNKTAETIEVAHPVVEKLRKRSRAQVEPVMKNDKRTEGRPIR